MKKSYGFTYDKQGNLKQVSAPIIVQGNVIHSGLQVHTCTPHKKTKTGKIIPTVGHPGF